MQRRVFAAPAVPFLSLEAVKVPVEERHGLHDFSAAPIQADAAAAVINPLFELLQVLYQPIFARVQHPAVAAGHAAVTGGTVFPVLCGHHSIVSRGRQDDGRHRDGKCADQKRHEIEFSQHWYNRILTTENRDAAE